MLSITEQELLDSSFDQLKKLADRVGIGYAELDEEGLRERLKFEGATQ